MLVEVFADDDAGYLEWIEANPQGFVANVDKKGTVKHYPMVHAVKHRIVSSDRIGGFTTGSYMKICSNDLAALEKYSQANYGRSLTHCRQCV